MFDDSSVLQEINSALSNNDISLFLNLCETALSNNNLSNKSKGQVSFTLGSYYMSINDKQNAIISFSKSLSYDNEKLYAYIRKCELLIDLNRIEAAVHCCHEGLNKFPNDNNLLRLKGSLNKNTEGQSSMKASNKPLHQVTEVIEEANDTMEAENKVEQTNNTIDAQNKVKETNSAAQPNSEINEVNDETIILDKSAVKNALRREAISPKTITNNEFTNEPSTQKVFNEKIPHEIDFGNTPAADNTRIKPKSNTPFIIVCSILSVIIVFGLAFFTYIKFIKSNDDVNKLLTSKSTTDSANSQKDTDSKDKKIDDKVEDSSSSSKNDTSTKSSTSREKYLVNNENPASTFSGSLADNKDFVFNDSDKIKLSYSDLTNKTLDELFIARNEIFARHGYIFASSPNLDSYFKSKSWYSPNSNSIGNTSNNVEDFNADLIKQVEVARIAHYNYGDKTINSFVISDSDKRVLSDSDVKALQDWELMVARNELFARHGLRFGIPQLADHFANQSWYKGDSNFDASKMSKLEYDNVEVIKKEELSRYNKMLTR